MKKLSHLLVSVVVLFSCESKKVENGIVLSGEIANPVEGGLIKLELVKNDELTVTDSFKLDDTNKFMRTVAIDEPAFYRLNLYGRKYVNLILNDTDVKVKADVNDRNAPPVIEGSPDTDYIMSLVKIQENFQRSVNKLNSTFMQARNNADEASIKKIQDAYMEQKKESDKLIKEKIWNMGSSISGILALQFLPIEEHFTFYDSVATKYKEILPNSSYTKNLVVQVDNLRKLAIGSPAPEISLPNPDGEIVSLSSFKGKYVMIDFWAAWCRPCRMENPNVVRLYEQYNKDGFEVFSVSLDRTKDAWVKAIEDDGLKWTHVSDLKYFQSEAAATYSIQAIPATYLIDPDGNILAKNLRGEELAAKLKEIFG
ncbi:TlpA disulfide reductase family protein [Reichenbachiella sp. MALMAid0571]|uniref:peroxiredoxin family protein n=1 Tax=Reichenbachiella sp. MALMAid0571 TaxID=3143939 RepID=UPI0032DEA3D1